MEKEMRIISLLPSGTEIIYALGLGNYLVGRSHECDYPKEVQQLPICSQPKYRSDGNSAEINKAVKTILELSLSIYKVDVEKIKALKPTHILTQSQCEVCAVSTDELQEALNEYLKDSSIKIIDSNPSTLEKVLKNIQEVANATGIPERGKSLVNQMNNSFKKIHTKTKNLSNKPTVADIEWIEPILVGGHWMMELIEMAGGTNCFPDEKKRWLKFENIIEKNPDKIFIAPCGFSIQRTLQEMYFLENRSEWNTLKAVRNMEIYVCDGNNYFNRPGPRLVESLEILAEIFHPEIFPSQHHFIGWTKRLRIANIKKDE
ncbi:MAG: cobalamin-binding protein [Bacteroidetes bacterium]|nr:cobalamin-binding protein [Bacteroidota bacterium]